MEQPLVVAVTVAERSEDLAAAMSPDELCCCFNDMETCAYGCTPFFGVSGCLNRPTVSTFFRSTKRVAHSLLRASLEQRTSLTHTLPCSLLLFSSYAGVLPAVDHHDRTRLPLWSNH